MEARGRVHRWDFTAEPKLYFLREATATLEAARAAVWTEKQGEAWVFPTMNQRGAPVDMDADAQAKLMSEAGWSNVHAAVVSTDEQLVLERQQRRETAVAQAEASTHGLDPHAVYEETSRRLGEREPEEVE